jgi:hypothetical protein
MKKTTIILIPVVIIILVIAYAFLMRTGELSGSTQPQGTVELPNSYGEDGSRPEAGMGTMESTEGAPATAADPGSQVSDLDQELSSTADDGGASDLQEIQNDAAGL